MPSSRVAVRSPDASPKPSSQRHIPELDGIRGLAILIVIVFHFGGFQDTGANVLVHAWRGVVSLSWTGVDLFFVLSGCLITGILVDSKGSPNYFRSFYMPRVLRIFPLYYLCLLFFFGVMLPSARHSGVERAWMHLPAWEQLPYWVYLSNWRSAFGPFAFSPIGHLWSLSIEEQFYIVWPAVVFLLTGKALLRLCGVLILVPLVLRNLPMFQAMQTTHEEFLYRLTPFRVDTLACGAAIALLARIPSDRYATRLRVFLLVVGSALLIAAIASTGYAGSDTPAMTRLGFTGVALLCCFPVHYAMFNSGAATGLGRFLRNGFLRSLGKFSYAMYLFHFLIASFLRRHIEPYFPSQNVTFSLVSTLAGLAAAYLLAVISWNLVEKHFLRMKRFFPY